MTASPIELPSCNKIIDTVNTAPTSSILLLLKSIFNPDKTTNPTIKQIKRNINANSIELWFILYNDIVCIK